MKLIRIAFPLAIAAAVALTGCSGDKETSQQKATTTSTAVATTTAPAVAATSTTSPAAAPAPAPALNNEPSAADSAAFVAAFRAQFPEFALGRKDNPIKNLLENTCQEISIDKEPDIIVSNVGKRAAYQSINPTAEQSQAIFDLAASHCSN